MYKQPLKPILLGVAVGIAIFAVPFFLLKAIFFFLVIGGLFRFFVGRRSRWGRNRGLHPSFADTIRDMDEEEYKNFRQTISGDYHHRKEIPITDGGK